MEEDTFSTRGSSFETKSGEVAKIETNKAPVSFLGENECEIRTHVIISKLSRRKTPT